MNPSGPIYTSKRMAKNLWQEYRVCQDRLELQSWLLLHTIVVPANDIEAIEVRPFIFSGEKGFTWGVKIDFCDLCRHVLLTRKSGFTTHIGFSPDAPEQFVEVCRLVMSNRGGAWVAANLFRA